MRTEQAVSQELNSALLMERALFPRKFRRVFLFSIIHKLGTNRTYRSAGVATHPWLFYTVICVRSSHRPSS